MAVPSHRDAWLLPTLEQLLQPEALLTVRGGQGDLWDTAVSGGFTTDEELVAAVAARFRAPIADTSVASTAARDVVSEALARRYRIIPLQLTDTVLQVATSNPNDLDCERALGFATGRSVRMSIAAPSVIAAKIEELYRPAEVVDQMLDAVSQSDLQMVAPEREDTSDFDLGDKASARPIIRLVDHIIAEGIGQRASDIHLEVQEGGVQVTYRIDGVLRPNTLLPRAVGTPLVSRIKIMSGLDIADRLRPQDGRARVAIDGKRVDLRVSTLPASTGEKVVIRILDTTASVLELDTLGVREGDLDRLQHLVNLREGIILVTGPTGSGKTTTLYAALKTIQARGVNIVTVEDPVEYKLNGIVQVQVNEKAGLTFATALRSILRQDPDVVFVGEIRDRETAGIAIQASLTGHLVLSTLHTIDAASSVSRLLDIGIESYKIGAALKGIVAQRLIRRLCAYCKVVQGEPHSSRVQRWIPRGTVCYKASEGGCEECGHTGYRGRVALMEILVTTPEVERRISAGESAERIAEAGRLSGMRSLWESGIDHVCEGVTDVDELLRVVEMPLHPPSVLEPVRAPTPIAQSVVRPRPGSGRQPVVQDTRQGSSRSSAPFSGEAFELVDDLAVAVGAPVATARILVADDTTSLRESARDALEASGFAVLEVADGITALDEIDQSPPDVVLLSLKLARMDGMGVLARLRARRHTANLPVVLMTDEADEEAEVRAFEAGAADFVVRPVSPRVLVARIRARLKE